MKKLLRLSVIAYLLFLMPVVTGYAQSGIFSDDSALISFFSSAPLEDISAENTSVRAILNTRSGDIAVLVRIDRFSFKKRLMQKHFNEQYLESDKYPEATFEGKIINFDLKDLGPEPEPYPVEGTLTIHGVKKDFKGSASIYILNNVIYGDTEFNVLLDDYKIKIPRLLIKNIAEEIKVNVKMIMERKQ
ncbi:MAG: YceI family protein [Bacteroidales bacterium]|nr:YceI family protein [Bacteroidales bacterium]